MVRLHRWPRSRSCSLSNSGETHDPQCGAHWADPCRNEGLIPPTQRLPDGFADKWRGPVEESMEVPETLLTDTRRDPRLLELCNQALTTMKKGVTLRDKLELLARLIADRMGGTMMLDNVADATESLNTLRQTKMKNRTVLIGDVTCGLSRHRALLFKFLADRCNIPTALCRGTHLVSLEDLHNFNTVEIDGVNYVPNLMRDIGAFYPATSDMARSYLRVQQSEGRLLYFPNCYLPKHQRPTSAQAREFVPLADVSLDQLPDSPSGPMMGTEHISDRSAGIDPRLTQESPTEPKTELLHAPEVCGIHQQRPTVHPKLDPLKYIEQKTAASVVQVSDNSSCAVSSSWRLSVAGAGGTRAGLSNNSRGSCILWTECQGATTTRRLRREHRAR